MLLNDILAIIPCRHGSKRFPDKNIAMFNDMTLIENTIQIARRTGIKNIIVSTDDTLIMDICNKNNITFIHRPAELCFSDSKSEDVIRHAIDYAMNTLNIEFETVCMLQVTSPLLRPSMLKAALEVYIIRKLSSLVAVNNIYEPAGAFYIFDIGKFLSNKSFYQTPGGIWVLPPDQSLDIDYPYQLEIAHAIKTGRIYNSGKAHVY